MWSCWNKAPHSPPISAQVSVLLARFSWSRVFKSERFYSLLHVLHIFREYSLFVSRQCFAVSLYILSPEDLTHQPAGLLRRHTLQILFYLLFLFCQPSSVPYICCSFATTLKSTFLSSLLGSCTHTCTGNSCCTQPFCSACVSLSFLLYKLSLHMVPHHSLQLVLFSFSNPLLT